MPAIAEHDMPRLRFASYVALALSTALASQAPAPDAAQPAKFVLAAGEHMLTDVITSAARYLGRNYLLAPTEIPREAMKVTLQQPIEADAAGCEAALTQLAYTQGLVAVPLDRARGLWHFVNINGPRRIEIGSRAFAVTLPELKAMRSAKVAVIVRLQLRHVSSGTAAQTLRPLFASGGGNVPVNIGTAEETSVLLVQGMADDVARAVDAIEAIDVPPLAGPKATQDQLAALEARVKALEETVRRLSEAKTDKGK